MLHTVGHRLNDLRRGGRLAVRSVAASRGDIRFGARVRMPDEGDGIGTSPQQRERQGVVSGEESGPPTLDPLGLGPTISYPGERVSSAKRGLPRVVGVDRQ